MAAPSWNGDSAYQAAALDWIVDQNRALPEGQKIRVVSVSAAPSGPGSPFTQNQTMWDAACARAEADGILVLDCTVHRGVVGACWYDPGDPENVAKCRAGFPSWTEAGYWPGHVLAPTSRRTTAEDMDYPGITGTNSYVYWGQGGLSWAIPYCAGVLAMRWQVHPELSGREMLELLRHTAFALEGGQSIINPSAFVERLQTMVTPRIDKARTPSMYSVIEAGDGLTLSATTAGHT